MPLFKKIVIIEVLSIALSIIMCISIPIVDNRLLEDNIELIKELGKKNK